MSSDGDLASATEPVQQGTFGRSCGAGIPVVEKSKGFDGLRSSEARFDGDGTLSSRRTHLLDGNEFADHFVSPEAFQACSGEDDGVVLAGFQLTQAGIDIAA